jgi:hypothetical protein
MEVASDLELSLSNTMRTETPQPITTPKKAGLTPIPTERLRPHVVPSEGSQSSPESQRGEYGPRTGVASEAAQQIYDLANVSDMISVLRSEKTRLEARVAELTSEVNAQKLQLESAAYTKASMEGEFENKLKLLQAQTVAEADLQKIALSKLTEELRVKDQLLVSMRTERSEALGSEQAELLRLRSERASENDVLRTKEDALRALEARARGAEEELARVRAEARERHDELAARRAAAEDAAAAERQRAAETEARAEALCAEQETGAAERKALSGELARLQAALASQAAAAEAAAGEKEALQAEVAGLTKQVRPTGVRAIVVCLSLSFPWVLLHPSLSCLGAPRGPPAEDAAARRGADFGAAGGGAYVAGAAGVVPGGEGGARGGEHAARGGGGACVAAGVGPRRGAGGAGLAQQGAERATEAARAGSSIPSFSISCI